MAVVCRFADDLRSVVELCSLVCHHCLGVSGVQYTPQLGASLGLALPTLWFWPQRLPSATAWLALLALGVMCTGIAYILYFRMIENLGPARALTVTFVIPVFAVLYGVVLLGETISLWMVLCAIIIVGGTALSAGVLRLRHKIAGI